MTNSYPLIRTSYLDSSSSKFVPSPCIVAVDPVSFSYYHPPVRSPFVSPPDYPQARAAEPFVFPMPPPDPSAPIAAPPAKDWRTHSNAAHRFSAVPTVPAACDWCPGGPVAPATLCHAVIANFAIVLRCPSAVPAAFRFAVQALVRASTKTNWMEWWTGWGTEIERPIECFLAVLRWWESVDLLINPCRMAHRKRIGMLVL